MRACCPAGPQRKAGTRPLERRTVARRPCLPARRVRCRPCVLAALPCTNNQWQPAGSGCCKCCTWHQVRPARSSVRSRCVHVAARWQLCQGFASCSTRTTLSCLPSTFRSSDSQNACQPCFLGEGCALALTRQAAALQAASVTSEVGCYAVQRPPGIQRHQVRAPELAARWTQAGRVLCTVQ